MRCAMCGGTDERSGGSFAVRSAAVNGAVAETILQPLVSLAHRSMRLRLNLDAYGAASPGVQVRSKDC